VRVPPFPKVDVDPTLKNSRAAVSRRLCSPGWWERQLAKKYRRDAEAVQIRAGNVCKGVSPYVSQEAVDRHKDAMLATEAWKKQAVLISSEGDEISLDGNQHEHAASFIRFAEYMVRINGMAKIAGDNYLSGDALEALPDFLKQGTKAKNGGGFADIGELGVLAGADPEQWVGIFFTLTAPSRFHRYTVDRITKQVKLNEKYDTKKTPSDARDWLQETWKLTQTAWKRRTQKIQPVDGLGTRMDESHHDGVSHYHYAIWVKAKDAQRAVQMFYDKALRGEYTDRVKRRWACQYGIARDATEAGALVRRLNFKVMTSAPGMVSYMVKYITKGITGADWDDLKEGIPSDETIVHIMARKSVWGLRQYAFWNAPSIMAWRELRRMEGKQESPVLEAARIAAKAKDWKAYTEANGGAGCASRARPIRMFRETKTNKEPQQPDLNQYGEIVEQVRGLLVEGVEKRTRLKDWYLLSLGSLESILISKAERMAGYVPSFGEEIHNLVMQAKDQGKLSRIADAAGIVMFSRPASGSSSSSPGASAPLVPVGATSHGIEPGTEGAAGQAG